MSKSSFPQKPPNDGYAYPVPGGKFYRILRVDFDLSREESNRHSGLLLVEPLIIRSNPRIH